TALMAALMHDHPGPVEPAAPVEHAAAAPAPVSKADVTPESSVSTPDAWLERRLRVFERALNALEARAETTAQLQARAIAQLEERLAALGQGAPASLSIFATVKPAESAVPQLPVEAPAAEEVVAAPEAEKKPVPEPLSLAPLPVLTISKEEMADVLQSARDKARAAAAIAAEPKKPSLDKTVRARWLAIGALSLVVLFLCIGLTLGNTASATQPAWQGSGVTQRHVAGGALARTIALADAGDARAQARLALAYLRGQGVASDPVTALRWSIVAAREGQPVAQYLLGALYQQGEHVPADPQRAFAWFAAAAAKGNLKAMHNLGIAYAQGLGTMKDDAKAVEWFTRAAERGYVDSAFDLAVLYERGEGVPQDLRQALKWYGIAGLAGDAPSKARAEVLRGQLNPVEAKLAANAAQAFTPLPALGEANSL
ncbi:MAG TPA: tetratricopeptide repeat protein, partial [Rhizomicrobium sp.]|nr:tetratricopeptide repeat protein [Rhizomicrobium sp.]